MSKDNKDLANINKNKALLSKGKTSKRKAGYKSTFTFGKIKKSLNDQKHWNKSNFSQGRKHSPKRTNFYPKKLPDSNLFNIKDLGGAISKHSSIGRMKEMNESEQMNISAPIKISKYIK